MPEHYNFAKIYWNVLSLATAKAKERISRSNPLLEHGKPDKINNDYYNYNNNNNLCYDEYCTFLCNVTKLFYKRKQK